MSDSRKATVSLAKQIMHDHFRSLDNPGRVEVLANYIDNYIDHRDKEKEIHKDNGLVPDNIFMSKRTQIAAMAMQSIITKPIINLSLRNTAEAAVQYADALIKELEDQ